MSGLLNQQSMTLKERLKLHKGFSAAVRAEGFASEPGAVEQVGKQFMKVAGQFFVPSAVDEVSLIGIEAGARGNPAILRSVTRGTFEARLIRTGEDFVEVVVYADRGSREWLLIPLNKIISIEQA